MDLAPRTAHGRRGDAGRWGVQKAIARWVRTAASRSGSRKAPSLTNDVGQPLVVSVGKITLKRPSARTLSMGRHRQQQRIILRHGSLYAPTTQPPAFSMASCGVRGQSPLWLLGPGHSAGSEPLVPGLALRGRRRAGARFWHRRRLYPTYLQENCSRSGFCF